MTKKIIDVLAELDYETSGLYREEILRSYVMDVIDECVVTARESYVDNPAETANRIELIKQQL